MASTNFFDTGAMNTNIHDFDLVDLYLNPQMITEKISGEKLNK